MKRFHASDHIDDKIPSQVIVLTVTCDGAIPRAPVLLKEHYMEFGKLNKLHIKSIITMITSYVQRKAYKYGHLLTLECRIKTRVEANKVLSVRIIDKYIK